MYQFKPTQIKEVIIPDNTENAEAFMYEYTNLKNDMKYVGKRKGKPLVGYYFSSKDEKFIADFSDKDAKFKFEVLEYGSEVMMLAKETKELKRVNAKNNDMYYNQSNGYADDSIIVDTDEMIRIAKDILSKNQSFTAYGITVVREKVEKAVLLTMNKLQTRRQTLFTKHKQDLQQEILDKGGNTDHLTVVYLEERNVKDKKGKNIVNDQMIGGNHSGSAILSCKKADSVYVIRIPKEIHKNWSDAAVRELSNFLNPRKKNRVLESELDDIEDTIFEKLVSGFKVNSPEVVKIYNFFHLNTRDRTNISKKANKRIKDKESNALNWINYSSDPYKSDLEDKVKDENNHPNVFCKAYSTGKLDYWRDILRINSINKGFIDNKQPEKVIKVYKVILWHPSKPAETEHFKLNSANDKYNLDWVWNRNDKDTKESNICPVQVIIEYLPSTKMKDL